MVESSCQQALLLKSKVLIQLVSSTENQQSDDSSCGSLKSLSPFEASEMCCKTLDELEVRIHESAQQSCSVKAVKSHGNMSIATKATSSAQSLRESVLAAQECCYQNYIVSHQPVDTTSVVALNG